MMRRIHTWVGLLIAPSLLFFSLTGALQLFSLHEAHGGYTPPALFVALGSLHKDQVLPSPPRPQPDAGPGRHDDHEKPPRKPATLGLKIVFLAVAGGLFLSTVLGVWMALRDRLRRKMNLALLAVGLVLPLALVVGLA